MRLGAAGSALALAAALASGSAPAKAATTASLLVPNPVFSTADAWFAAGCDPAYEDSPANGVDSVVVSASPGPRRITWSGTAIPGRQAFEVQAILADCTKYPMFADGGTIALPSGTRWLAVHNRGVVNGAVAIS